MEGLPSLEGIYRPIFGRLLSVLLQQGGPREGNSVDIWILRGYWSRISTPDELPPIGNVYIRLKMLVMRFADVQVLLRLHSMFKVQYKCQVIIIINLDTGYQFD